LSFEFDGFGFGMVGDEDAEADFLGEFKVVVLLEECDDSTNAGLSSGLISALENRSQLDFTALQTWQSN
jgi:hypothetical protein